MTKLKPDFLCPACYEPLNPPHVSSSRFVPERTGTKFDPIYICSACGTREALEGFFWSASPNATNPPSQLGFKPYG